MKQRDAVNSTAPTARGIGVRFGSILGVSAVLYFVVLTQLGLETSAGFWLWLKYVFIIAIIYFAHRSFKYKNSGLLEYGHGVSISSWAGIVFGLIDGGFRYLYLKFIDPGYIETLKSLQTTEMENKGMSPAEIKQAVGITALIMNAEFIAFITFLSAIVGAVVIGLILSIFTRTTFSRNT